jgi:bifunctional non-homologous end joining protein LigD
VSGWTSKSDSDVSVMSPECPPGPPLPHFIEPMLAVKGEAFDSAEHLFEIKWDGTRALVFVEGGSYRIMNRRRRDITHRYPELSCLKTLPDGTVLDGEIVVIEGGRPNFEALQRRDQPGNLAVIRRRSHSLPATYVVFDQLVHRHRPIMGEPCALRREIAAASVCGCEGPQVIMSDGVVGGGKAYFLEACRRGLEGMLAKRLDSPYLPGKRSSAWVKIKRRQSAPCVVIGYTPAETASGALDPADFRALILASDVEGALRYVGRVGSGFTVETRERVNRLLREAGTVAKPVTFTAGSASERTAIWLEPKVYCYVSFMERTRDGHLRAPVFEGIHGD